MIIKINNDTEYDFVEAKRENGQIVGTLIDGNEVILGGNIPGIDELFSKEPTTEQRVLDLEKQLAQSDEIAIALYEAQETQEVINAQQDEALMQIYEMIGL